MTPTTMARQTPRQMMQKTVMKHHGRNGSHGRIEKRKKQTVIMKRRMNDHDRDEEAIQ